MAKQKAKRLTEKLRKTIEDNAYYRGLEKGRELQEEVDKKKYDQREAQRRGLDLAEKVIRDVGQSIAAMADCLKAVMGAF